MQGESLVSTAAFDVKEQVRQASDIAAVVGSYLELRRQGRNLVARCPWHDDTRPSLQVNPDRQSWKCWVCDIGGDVFSFIMQREGVEFREALEMLADRAGIEIHRGPREHVQPGSADDKRALYAAMVWAEQQFHRYLLEAMEGESARAYLKERGISAESIEQFHIGFAPKNFTWLVERARGTQFSPEILQASGLAGKSTKSGRPYDFFRGRVMFPIRDTQHRPIAFGGRILPQFADEKTGKYVNSPETRLYSKIEQLYGLDIAGGAVTKDRHIVVMEGYTDVIMAHQYGVNNVVAVCGTAIGSQHVRPRSLLRRYADRVTLVLDGDEAGQKRTNEVLELFVAEQIDLRIATLPAGLDPCDYLQQQGAEEFGKLIAAAPDALEHSLNSALAGIDIKRDAHAANQAMETILSRMAKAPRLSSESDAALRLREGQMLQRVARSFGESETAIRERLAEMRSAARKRGDEYRATSEPVELSKLSIEEEELFGIFCVKPQLVEHALQMLESTRTGLETCSTLAQQLLAVYRAVLAEGDYPDCSRILTELDDGRLKNILATLDWQAHDREPNALQTPEERLESVMRRLQTQDEDAKLQRFVQGQASDADPLEMLKQAIEQRKSRMM